MPELDCRRCKRWQGCIGKDWFSYADLRFCPLQVLWILEHKETLRSGCWPQDPYESSNPDPTGRSIKTEASFVKPDIVIAELEERLRRAGPQAELLICQVEDSRSFSNLSSGAWEVLMYVKGSRRKDTTFSQWQRQKRYRHKMNTQA